MIESILCSWLICGIILIISLYYWYSKKKFNFWSKQGIAGPKPLPIVGNALHQVLIPMPTLELDWFRKYGKIYGIYIGTKPVLTVVDPELIKQILVKDFHIFINKNLRNEKHMINATNLINVSGKDWQRIRSTVSPTFSSGKMKKMFPMIRQCLTEFMDCLESYADINEDINARKMFSNFTIDVIATCAYGTKTNTHKDPNNGFSKYGNHIFQRKTLPMLLMLICPTFLLRFLKIDSLWNEEVLQFFLDVTTGIVKERKKDKRDYNDFIQLLLNAEKNMDVIEDINDVYESHHVNEGDDEIAAEKKALNIGSKNKHLSEDEIVAQAFIFFVAGYETTSTALTFCSYELALNPEIQERLYKEIIASVDTNGEIDYELLAKLPFLDAIISETLRLHSVVVRIGRVAAEEYRLGDTGITLAKGQAVDIPLYAVHHSEEFYPNPDVFDPDRFMPENRHKLIPYTYLPFSVGPRNCVGMRFALMETKLALVHILQKYRFIRSAKTETPLPLNRLVRLKSPKRAIIRIQKR